MAPAEHEDEDNRRRRGLFLLLGAAVLLLLLGLVGGYLAFEPSPATGSGRRPPGVPVVGQPTGQPAVAPTAVPVVVQGTGQAVSQPSASSSATTRAGAALVVTSRVDGRVGPGTPATLVLTIANPGPRSVVVTAVTARITEVGTGPSSGPRCSAAWYAVGDFGGTRTVGAGSSTTIALPVTFVDSSSVNQDSCKGARFTYTYRAEGREA